MNKYEELLIFLKGGNMFGDLSNENLELAEELIDKETPMKRIESISNAFCGECGYAFGYNKVIEQRTLNYKHLRYCPCCGQKIDWSEDNE